MIRKERKGPSGLSNISHSTKHKVKPMAQNDPGWLHFMSMPKLKQNKIFGVGPIVHPDNVKVTKESYKNHGKKVKKILEPIQAYNSIQNLHMPFKLQPGVSNFISDYDPDPYVQDHLLHTCKSHLKPIWTMRDVEGEQTTRMNRGDANNNKGESVENCNPSAIQMLDAIQDKIDKRRDRKSLVRMFDQEGKKEITEDNIKNVLDALGFNYDEKHAKVIYHMANPSKNGAPPSTADIYKLLSNENLSKQFKDKTSFEDIKKEFDDNAYRKKKEGILTVITNDIKNIHKQLVDATEAGFVPPDKVKKILMNSAKSWEQADPKVIEEIVKEKTTSNGVDSQELLELIADKKLRMQMEKDQLRKKHSHLEMDNLKIFDSKVSDNTIKPTFHKLDEINNKKNPLQQFLIKKYGDKATMEKKIREIVGDDENQINRENLFEFYKQSLNKEKLGIEDRQQFYKLTENLRFREDDAKVSIKDFADLAFGEVQKNDRLKENARYLHPIPPSDPQTHELEHSPDKTNFKLDHHPTLNSSSFLPGVRGKTSRGEEKSSFQFLDSSNSDPTTLKKLADRLEANLNSKTNNSYEMFKYFDRDNDGIIKKAEFQRKLADIGLCTDHQAGRLFETLKKDPSRVGMGYSEFHAGFSSLQDPKGPITYSPGHSSLLFPVTQSVTGTGKRQIRQPLDMNQFKKDLADRDFYHDTKPITEPLQQSALFMAPVDRFSREANHRELFIRQEQQKKHQLLQERVLNKSNVLNMYEDIRSRAELKNQNRETNNIHAMQNRSQLYGELIKMSEKPSNL